jgi:hypothetical protein
MRSPRGSTLALVAAAMLPAALVVVACRHGLGMTADSVGYVATARSFAADWEFTYWDGTPFTIWPPGLPLILGFLLKAGIDPLVSAFVLNVLAVSALVALTYLIGRQLLESPLVAFVPTAVTAVAISTIRVYSQLWSEPLFIVLCLAAIWLLMRIIRNGMSASDVLAVAACVSLACSVRYIGVALLPVVGISVLIAEARRGLFQATAAAVAVVALSGIGAALVALRNLILVGSLTGGSSISHASLGDLVLTALAIVGGWLVPEASVGFGLAVLAGLAIVGMATLGALFLAWSTTSRSLAVPLVAFVATHLVVLLISLLTRNVFLDFRYLAPLLPPTAILVVVGAWNLWSIASRSEPREAGARSPSGRRVASVVVRLALVMAVGLCLVGNARESLSFAIRIGRSGAGYNSDWRLASQLARAAGSIPASPGLLTNDPPQVYWVTGRHPIPSGAVLIATGDPAAALRAQIQAGGITHFADFTGSRTDQGVSAEQLRRWGVVLTDPVSYPEGILYRLTVPPAQSSRSGRGGGW